MYSFMSLSEIKTPYIMYSFMSLSEIKTPYKNSLYYV